MGQESKPNFSVPKSVLVVDDDPMSLTLLANYAQGCGVTSVKTCADGLAAWQALNAETFDLIVLDWKLPQLSGMSIFNRLRRSERFFTLPVLVVSGLLHREDFRLLSEFPCTALVEKPLTQKAFEAAMANLCEETAWFDFHAEHIATAVGGIERDAKEALRDLRRLLQDAPNQTPVALSAARQLWRHGHLPEAESMTRKLLERDDQCVPALGELGKILILQGKHEEAADVLRAAHKASPKNIERLCLLGEVELNLRNPDDAHRYFVQALEIDAEDAQAQAGVVLATNMKSHLASSSEALPRTFASLLNVIGIAKIRSGAFAEGIQQYRSALAFLGESDAAARLAFNLGLGFLRWGKPKEALHWFQRSLADSNGRFGKAQAYAERILANLSEDVKPPEPAKPAPAKVDPAPTSDDDGVKAAVGALKSIVESPEEGADESTASVLSL